MGSEVKAGDFKFTGKEKCDSGYEYDVEVDMKLNEDYSIGGNATLNSNEEDTEVCQIEGTWEKAGKLFFTMTYANNLFLYEGLIRENIIAGKCWMLDEEFLDYESLSESFRGSFRYVKEETQDNSNFLAKFSLE